MKKTERSREDKTNSDPNHTIVSISLFRINDSMKETIFSADPFYCSVPIFCPPGVCVLFPTWSAKYKGVHTCTCALKHAFRRWGNLDACFFGILHKKIFFENWELLIAYLLKNVLFTILRLSTESAEHPKSGWISVGTFQELYCGTANIVSNEVSYFLFSSS